MAKFIKTERSGRLLTVTISRPEVRNALNAEACRELSTVWDEFEADAGDGSRSLPARERQRSALGMI